MIATTKNIIEEINKREFISSYDISKIFYPKEENVNKRIYRLIFQFEKRGYLKFERYDAVKYNGKFMSRKILKLEKQIPLMVKREYSYKKYIIEATNGIKKGVLCADGNRKVISFNEEKIANNKIVYEDKKVAMIMSNKILTKFNNQLQTQIICL